MRKARLFDLNDALQHPGRRVALQVSTNLEEETDLDLVEPVVGELSAVSTGQILVIEGVLHTTVVLECARCTEPVEVPLEFQIHEEFPVEGVAAGYGSGGTAYVQPGEDAVMFKGNSLKYEELIRQDLWGWMPYTALCRPDCPGLPVPDTAPHGRPEFQILSTLLEEPEERG